MTAVLGETCTVYNKYTAADEERWERTVVEGVFWDGTRGAVMRRTGVAGGDSAMLLIPNHARTGGKEYLPPKVWEKAADKSKCWTVQPGDRIVRGECPAELEGSSRILEEWDDVMTVTAVAMRRFGGGMAHLEVRGKEYLWSLL